MTLSLYACARPLTAVMFLFCVAATSSAALVVNVEIDPRDPPDPVYDGDDGVLSTTGGTTWNHLGLDFLNDVSKSNLLDEFGNTTAVDVTFAATGSLDANSRPIELYAGGGLGTLDIEDLNPTSTYDLAVYGANSGLSITSTDFFGDTTLATGPFFQIEMPGDAGEEYVLFIGLTPYDLGGGVNGLTIQTNTGTQMAGFQLREHSVIPEPSSIMCWALMIPLALGVVILRRRRTS